MGGIEILFDGASGIYIPQRFAEECTGEGWRGVTDEDRAILAAGPDHEHYWDAWSDVIDNAEFHSTDGAIYSLHQDDDVFICCRDRMTVEEQVSFFDGEYDPPEGTEVFRVLEHFAEFIEYGDASGLSDIEARAIDAWLERYPPARYVVSVESALAEDFDECDICGMRGRLTGVLVVDMGHAK